MAITAAGLTSGNDGSGGFISNATTSSYGAAADRLQLFGLHSAAFQPDQIDPPISIVQSTTLTLTQVAFVRDTTTGQCLSVYRALQASPPTGTSVITFDETQYYGNWSVIELAGIDTSGTNGSGAIVQTASSKDVAGSATSSAVTLATFGDVNNATVIFTAWTTTGSTIRTCTPKGGFTEVHDTGTTYAGAGAASAIQSQFKAGNDTTPTGTWSGAGAILSLALEIKAAVGGGGGGTTPLTRSRRSGSGGMGPEMSGGISARGRILVPDRRFFLPSRIPSERRV